MTIFVIFFIHDPSVALFGWLHCCAVALVYSFASPAIQRLHTECAVRVALAQSQQSTTAATNGVHNPGSPNAFRLKSGSHHPQTQRGLAIDDTRMASSMSAASSASNGRSISSNGSNTAILAWRAPTGGMSEEKSMSPGGRSQPWRRREAGYATKDTQAVGGVDSAVQSIRNSGDIDTGGEVHGEEGSRVASETKGGGDGITWLCRVCRGTIREELGDS